MTAAEHCLRCGTGLERRVDEEGIGRPTCPACGYVHYVNPAPTVQAWIDRDGAYLALRRNREPLKGRWNLPGGFVEAGEGGAAAIAREVREETGLRIEVGGLIGIFASSYGSGADEKPILDIAYRCRIEGDGAALTVSDESQEAGWFALAEFPEPAFSGERQALAALRDAAA